MSNYRGKGREGGPETLLGDAQLPVRMQRKIEYAARDGVVEDAQCSTPVVSSCRRERELPSREDHSPTGRRTRHRNPDGDCMALRSLGASVPSFAAVAGYCMH